MKNAFVEDFKEMLRTYPEYENKLQNINDELEQINSILCSPRGANSTSFNFGGSDYNSVENRTNNLLAKSGKLSEQLIYLEYQYLTVKKALTFLNNEELNLISLRYFRGFKIAKLELELYKSRSVIYEQLNKALSKMLWGLYGKIR